MVAICYVCGGDVEEGPRFGAEAVCDTCRRDGRLLMVCAWCPERAEAVGAMAARMGLTVSHGICADHARAFQEGQ